MTRTDYRIIFTALGFLAVILRDDIAKDKQALRATSVARLIESFCTTSIPDAFISDNSPSSPSLSEAESLLEHYIAELRDHGSARLSFDRKTLLDMYELLIVQKTRNEQPEFYALAPDDVIANQILRLAEEQINQKEQA